jgi:hypothetical protein
MLRLLEDRIWLTDHPSPDVTPLVHRTPTELVDRQHQLQQLLAEAPADQRAFIERVVTSQLEPTEMHEYLTAAMAVQDARRAWIITNWPHLVELEQITTLINAQAPLAHWPDAQPDEVRRVLDQLRAAAPALDQREDHTLAELDRREADADPVRSLEARRDRLRRLAARVMTQAEQDAIDDEIASTITQLRSARRQRHVEHTFDRYQTNPIKRARSARIATLAADTLTAQPAWVVDHVRFLHEHHQLTTCDIAALAQSLTAAAVAGDGVGGDPAALMRTEPPTPTPIPSTAMQLDPGGHP